MLEIQRQPVLSTEHICMYFGGLHAVEDINLEIHQGDIYGIIGPNGAGKTTLFNSCTGFNLPTKGKVFLCGEDITNLKPEQIAKKGMARTFQNIKLFKYMSVLDNIKIGFHLNLKSNLIDTVFHTKQFNADEAYAIEKGKEILDLVGLSKYTETKAGNLPYGVQRKVEIARALAINPKILLLDEPAAGMNPNETKELSDYILKINALGYTIGVIEHDMKFVMNTCNRIIVLNFGQQICEGTPDVIKTNQNVREAYFGKGLVAGEAINVAAEN
ncbi:ABC-type branched-chain amino acid transport systems, ATPase component [Sphaerochaeta pleomorpha str. Grapes]|uniref:ABC-type branched-chain amino acid transport systems, ATPase component n=1 Tax=Sphaerochaeta pleomorpha (strain ATCC BAA-1885 / DSM 22778 / Grapes) TaxID=158190 RepID=G8QXH4_SPHPG|nr:ABC transporter ATP-binding protein [Sphaerochaeta pleomorpha]AEV29537.1 ABC-type branched-chain amino acid transport systems, ATPase component [Sphaerochaeta pleomorpha str. Grapes]